MNKNDDLKNRFSVFTLVDLSMGVFSGKIIFRIFVNFGGKYPCLVLCFSVYYSVTWKCNTSPYVFKTWKKEDKNDRGAIFEIPMVDAAAVRQG